MRGFLYGFVFTIALIAGATIAAVYTGALPSGADVKPSSLERRAAKISLSKTIARETEGMTDPVATSDQNLADGIKLYATNCAVCHGASDAKPSMLAQGFYIRAPQLAKRGVEDDPEPETFWKIKHGIRFTAMPAFTERLTDDDIWKLTNFLKTMDKLPPGAQALWKKVPSAAECCG